MTSLRWLGGAVLYAALSACAAGVARQPAPAVATRPPAFVDSLQRRTFAYFWETTNPRNGLAPDRWPNPPFASIAAVGFALTAYPIGVARGWVARADAAERTLTFLDAFNATLQDTTVRLRRGRIVAGKGWFDDNYLGIDQGPIVAMIENHRSALVWELMKKNPYIVRGLCRAGFTGGWIQGRCN